MKTLIIMVSLVIILCAGCGVINTPPSSPDEDSVKATQSGNDITLIGADEKRCEVCLWMDMDEVMERLDEAGVIFDNEEEIFIGTRKINDEYEVEFCKNTSPDTPSNYCLWVIRVRTPLIVNELGLKVGDTKEMIEKLDVKPENVTGYDDGTKRYIFVIYDPSSDTSISLRMWTDPDGIITNWTIAPQS